MAEIKVTASARNSTMTEIHTGNHTIYIDEPPFFGGEDQAPSPVAMFLASLAGCINAIGQWVAKEMEITIESLQMEIVGEVDAKCFCQGDESVRAGFSAIRVTLDLVSDAKEEVANAWKEAVMKRCPVCDNICHPAEFSLSMNSTLPEGTKER